MDRINLIKNEVVLSVGDYIIWGKNKFPGESQQSLGDMGFGNNKLH